MRILITTGVEKDEVGGPSQYGFRLADELRASGHEVRLKGYSIEKKLPLGIRHLFFLLKILPHVVWGNALITLDTFSVGLPSVVIGKVLNKKTVVRIGGDFLWEAYVRRTGEKITLSKFNESLPVLNKKEEIIFRATAWLCANADVLAFNTLWQKEIWKKRYKFHDNKLKVIHNFVPPKMESRTSKHKTFIWAGRKTVVKNVDSLLQAVENVNNPEFKLEIITEMPHEQLLLKLSECYAVILPSISDVCPNFILEAVSYNKPFVMTQETGMREICKGGGVFVNAIDEVDIRKGIELLLNDGVYEEKVRELERFEVSRTWKQVAAEFESACGVSHV